MDKIVAASRKRDFLAKGVCLLLAVILWAFIISGKTETLRYKVPIVTRNLPANLAVSDMSGRYTVLVLEGRKDELKSVNIKNIKANVNMENAVIEDEGLPDPDGKAAGAGGRGAYPWSGDVTLTVENKGGEVDQGRPNHHRVRAEGKDHRRQAWSFPERVKISGPKSHQRFIESIETEEVSVENETADLQRQVGPKKERLKDITFSEKIFTVKVAITDMRDLAVVTVPVGPERRQGVSITSCGTARSRSMSGRKTTARLAADEVEAFVDAGKLNSKALFGIER